MKYICSQCHVSFAADERPHACPNCKAEAGLEAEHGVPGPMKLFAVLVVGVLLASIVGGAVATALGT